MGKSSKDKRDIYYRLAKSDGYRARSAYKLIHLDEHFHFFDQPSTTNKIRRVVDLCAAPGSWSQVLSQKLGVEEDCDEDEEKSIIVAVDLQPMAPLQGVIQVVGDITKVTTAQQIVECFNGKKADVVVCDGAPDVTGLHDFDEFIQAQLLLAALNITLTLLEPGGTFIAKIFRGRHIEQLHHHLILFFSDVMCAKPRCSRNSSIEAFIVCRNFKMPQDYVPNMSIPLNLFTPPLPLPSPIGSLPFIACGDVSIWGDADMNYPAPDESSRQLDFSAKPTEPPYKEWMERRRKGEL